MAERLPNNRMLKIVCPKCQHESQFESWQCINATEENGLIEKVRDGSMFMHVCPECQQKINVEYSFLYHQVDDALMIHYCIKDEDVKAVIEALTHPNEEQQPFIRKMLENNTIVRVVRTKAQLLEKMCMYEAGMDDRVIEIMKIIVESKFKQDNPDKNVTGIFFNIMKRKDQPEDEGKKILQIYVDNKAEAEAEVNDELYKRVFEDFVSAMVPMRADRNVMVNPSWAKEVLKLKNAKPNPAE